MLLKLVASSPMQSPATNDNFKVQCKNTGTEGWTFALYQRQPNDDVTNLAWKVFNLDKPTPTVPTSGGAEWSVNYMVTIPLKVDGVFSINKAAGQFLPAKPGFTFTVQTVSGNTVISSPVPGTPNCIKMINLTASPLNFGVAMDGTLLTMVQQVKPSQTADFEILTDYYLGVYKQNSFKQGEIISYDFELGPSLIKFIQNYTVANLQVRYQNGVNSLGTPTYSDSITSVPSISNLMQTL